MSGKDMRVLYAQAVYGREEIDAAIDVLENSSTKLMAGDKVKEFERIIAGIFDKKFGLMVNSGSSANILALASLNLEPGAEIITPVLTFSTTVAPIVQQKFIPVFVDVEIDTYTIDSNRIEEMIGENTRAMVIPNLLGNLPDWSTLRSIADKYDLAVVEDSADTLGSLYNGNTTGSISDVVTSSFYGSHVVTCAGFGGIVCINDSELQRRATLLRSWGRGSSLMSDCETSDDRFSGSIGGVPYDAMFIFEEIGYNFLPSEIAAAFGIEQIKRLDGFMQTRIKNFENLKDFFKNHEQWFILPRQRENTLTAWLAFPLIVKEEAPFSRQELQMYFEERGIQTRTIFTGNILCHPGFKNISHRATHDGYPNSDRVMRGGILIGCHQGMREDQLDYVMETFEDFRKKL